MVRSDGADLWVANPGTATVYRVRASDGKLLDTWTGATGAFGVLVAMGKVFVAGTGSPGHLYQIDPTLAAGAVTTVTAVGNPLGIAFDGQQIWLANQGTGSVSIVTVNPLSVSTVSTGFTNLSGIVYDGANMWVTDNIAGSVDSFVN
jgi:DNA-binding beta-propeller fold protein YncE